MPFKTCIESTLGKICKQLVQFNQSFVLDSWELWGRCGHLYLEDTMRNVFLMTFCHGDNFSIPNQQTVLKNEELENEGGSRKRPTSRGAMFGPGFPCAERAGWPACLMSRTGLAPRRPSRWVHVISAAAAAAVAVCLASPLLRVLLGSRPRGH